MARKAINPRNNPEGQRIVRLYRAANDGDHEALAELIEWGRGADWNLAQSYSVLRMLEQDSVRSMVGKDSLFSQWVVEKETEAMLGQIQGPESSQLERLLAGRIVRCRWALAFAESQAARDGVSLAVAEYWDRCVSRAHRRFLQAVKALAEVRRLQMRPSLQLNIAEQQVNVGQVQQS